MSLKSKKWLINRKKFLRKKYKGICQLCFKPVTSQKEFSIDHIIPLSKGGSNLKENIQLAHKACNERKGNSIII